MFLLKSMMNVAQMSALTCFESVMMILITKAFDYTNRKPFQ